MNTPRTKASPTPNGKATAIPAMETEAESKMLEALKIIPPIKALTMYLVSTCRISSRKPLPESPKLPSVKTPVLAGQFLGVTPGTPTYHGYEAKDNG